MEHNKAAMTRGALMMQNAQKVILHSLWFAWTIRYGTVKICFDWLIDWQNIVPWQFGYDIQQSMLTAAEQQQQRRLLTHSLHPSEQELGIMSLCFLFVIVTLHTL